MKKPITPLAIIAVFIAFIITQSSVSYSSIPAPSANETAAVRDTVPEQEKPDKKKKKDRKDKDTSTWPQRDTTPTPMPDTFPSAYRP